MSSDFGEIACTKALTAFGRQPTHSPIFFVGKPD